jgi:putative hydrolase of the HAD superfamily
MIKNLIFDFGDVFINLDKEGAMKNALKLFNLNQFPEELNAINCIYEQGLISTNEFLDFYIENFPHLNKIEIIDAWNFILKDFPSHRLDFIKTLSENSKYNLILLSNTNELHINWIKAQVTFYENFKNCFHKFYLSHEIGLRKPDSEIFEFVINDNNINAKESLFIDDTIDNIKTAHKIGFHTWHIDETKEDITDLFKIKKHLF